MTAIVMCVCVCVFSNSPVKNFTTKLLFYLQTYYRTYYRLTTSLLQIYDRFTTDLLHQLTGLLQTLGSMLLMGASKILHLLIIFKSIIFLVCSLFYRVLLEQASLLRQNILKKLLTRVPIEINCFL